MSLFYNTQKYGNPIFSQSACRGTLDCDIEMKDCWLRLDDLFPTRCGQSHISDFRYTYDLFKNKLTWK